jgi:hypothetical protein
MKHVVYRKWHDVLNMPKKTKEWHEQDIADEYAELDEAVGPINRWSEYADVVYAVTRGRWDGHDIHSPLSGGLFMYGSLYMFPKYTLRYMFFRRAGKKLQSARPLHEVRNPKKVHKLHYIASKYDLDPEEFAAICKRQLRYWPLLK